MQFTAIKPLGDRVLVKIKESEEKSQGGILLPTTAQTKPQGGEVVAVGEGKTIGKSQVEISVTVICFVRKSLKLQWVFCNFLGKVGMFSLILAYLILFFCTDGCTSCVFKVCRY